MARRALPSPGLIAPSKKLTEHIVSSACARTVVLVGPRLAQNSFPFYKEAIKAISDKRSLLINYRKTADLITTLRDVCLSKKPQPVMESLACAQKELKWEIFAATIDPTLKAAGCQETKLYGTLEKVKCASCSLVKNWPTHLSLEKMDCHHCGNGLFFPDIVFSGEPIRDIKSAAKSLQNAENYLELGVESDDPATQIFRSLVNPEAKSNVFLD